MGDYPTDGIKLSFIKDLARGDLLDHLKLCDGTKAIFWDPKLKGPFNLIIDWAVLKQHGVKKMFELQEYIPDEVIENKWQSVIMLIRPNLPMIDMIHKAIRSVSVAQRDKIDFHIIFVSRKSTMCTQRLEKYNIIGEFKNILELELDLIPFDHDLLTLEHPLGFKEMCTELDDSCLYQVSRSLMSLQSYFGFFPNIIGIGPSAAKVNKMIQRMRKEGSAHEKPLTPRIENLVLIDRRVDLITPLSTQLTYEGLIDELFGIKNNAATFPGKSFLSEEEQAQQESEIKPKQILLNSNDTIYNVARDVNFNALGPFLGKKAKQISAAYNEKNDAKSLQQLKQFVSKLPHMQAERKSLEIQTAIAGLVKNKIDNRDFRHTLGIEQVLREGIEVDRVNEDIEEMIYKQEPLKKVLRLLCIQCIAADGLKPKVLEFYKREIIQSYGYHHLITFDRLEKCGLMYMQEKTPKKSYPILRSTLNLTVSNVNEREPNDIAYVHSGYAPLTVRLVNWMTQRSGLKYLADMVKHLPGPAFNDHQKLSTTQDRLEHSDNHTLVYFLGGCTYAEVSALRFLAQHHPNNATFTIATTKLINGNSLLDTLIEPCSKENIPDFLT